MATFIGASIAILGVIAFIILTVTALTVLNGFVLSQMWAWFVVPLFGLPALTIPYAIGLSMVFSLFTHRKPDMNKDKKAAWGELGMMVVGRLLVLAIGYVLKFWIM